MCIYGLFVVMCWSVYGCAYVALIVCGCVFHMYVCVSVAFCACTVIQWAVSVATIVSGRVSVAASCASIVMCAHVNRSVCGRVLCVCGWLCLLAACQKGNVSAESKIPSFLVVFPGLCYLL